MKPARSGRRASRWRQWRRAVGPGLVAGGANNDPAGIATFAMVGALTGFTQLWILLITTPMLIAVQVICGVVGVETRRGLATLLRIRFGWLLGLLLTLAFVIGNFAALTADTLILSDALALLTGLPHWYFPVLIVFLGWSLLVFHNFRRLIGTLVLLNLSFVTYIIGAFLLHPHWLMILKDSFLPHFHAPGVGRREFLTSAAALFGCRLSPYLFFWQASAETEKYTDVRLRGQTELDISVGMAVSNLIGYCIIVTTGATLFAHHIRVDSVAQAAEALLPVAGPAAHLLFTLGILGSGLIAIPVLAATSSYAVAETMEWRRGLQQRPWQARRFYMVLSGVLLLVGIMSYLPIAAISIAFWSQVFWGVLAPVILFLVLFIERRQSRERRLPISFPKRFWLATAGIMMSLVVILMLI